MDKGEPKPPTRCERHGDDYVEVTRFGGPRELMCVYCGADPEVPADAVYAEALKGYEERKREWDRWTPRIVELEAELRVG